jgi:tRNA modification GTPase
MAGPQEPTIAAIATPPGPGGIGIVRISGPDAQRILMRLFTPKRPTPRPVSHHLSFGWIKRPTTGQILDEVMAVYMAAPHTYTREDVAEIHCHGNFLILHEILVLAQEAGARLADPGEFTKRAYLNGRLDLTQAEAVLEVLKARTVEGLRLAVNQLHGGLHQQIQAVVDALIRLKAIIEVAIDFPDDDIEIIDALMFRRTVNGTIIPTLADLISAADNGKIFRDGIAVVIIGRPNVGKSSLLNTLLKEERAIVTAEAGTTRDTIEEQITVQGIPVRIIDTAGIRDSRDAVEEIGIQRSREKMALADCVLLLIDAAQPVLQADLDLLAGVAGKPLLVVANKSDLCSSEATAALQGRFPGHALVAISAKHGTGIRELEGALFAQVTGRSSGWDPGYSTVPNARHRAAMSKAHTACQDLLACLDQGLSPDLLAIELQTVLDHLGEIVGFTTTEEVLDKIFGEFCIGK